MICKNWLYELLDKNGPMDYRWVKAEAMKLGFNRRVLKDARKALGVMTEHLKFSSETNNETWYWRLPE